jgi:hypothetical protein
MGACSRLLDLVLFQKRNNPIKSARLPSMKDTSNKEGGIPQYGTECLLLFNCSRFYSASARTSKTVRPTR